MSVEEAVKEVIAMVDELGAPDEMSKEEYRDFLGELIDDLSARKDAVESELKTEESNLTADDE
jgi:hypothetical protein